MAAASPTARDRREGERRSVDELIALREGKPTFVHCAGALGHDSARLAPGRCCSCSAARMRAPRTETDDAGSLASRHVLQATAEQVFGDKALLVGAWVDGLHALTCFGFACADARWRRAALVDAADHQPDSQLVGWFEICSRNQSECRSDVATTRTDWTTE